MSNLMSANIYRIKETKRLMNSFNGNPRYRVTFEGGLVAQTSADAADSFGIANESLIGVDVVVTFDSKGHITHCQPSATAASRAVKPTHNPDLNGAPMHYTGRPV